MKAKESYIGFPPLPDADQIVEALVHDPPDRRWKVVRDLFRIDPQETPELISRLQPYLYETEDFRVKYRITIALQALHHTSDASGCILIKGKGIVQEADCDSNLGKYPGSALLGRNFAPIIDFHVHPKMPDLKFFGDMRQAGITHGVILATDTDPSDVDRPEIREALRKAYSGCAQSHRLPFENMLSQIRASLYSPTHVTNRDVADWVSDYPDILYGFGSVNLSKERQYVEQKLEEIRKLKLKGIMLLPFSQFFNPSENANINLLFDYCRQTGSIVLSHTGCGAGPFELLELSQNAHPDHWEPVLRKYPDVPLVLAHCGSYSTFVPGIWLHELLQIGKKFRNVFADIAAVEWLMDREMVVKEIRKTIGFDRILFGTDYPLPLTAGVSLAYLVSGLQANILLTEKEKRKILGENAARLLDIE
ncbi:MAG: amidohydrolase [Desulfomonile tiedjei]|uniref:Amidohydrolase n=1 Tax=Desulfomonile tiedjei TaxID=2358 RepID=A0A9D6UXE8_9BACT|nr:amidohydrolase [Desulfomonile tiedjei]